MIVKITTEMKGQNQDAAFITQELLQWAGDITCLGVLGLKKHGNLRKSLVLEDCFRNDVKVWIVTDSNEAMTLTDLNQMKIL
jgi:hypothetical protein